MQRLRASDRADDGWPRTGWTAPSQPPSQPTAPAPAEEHAVASFIELLTPHMPAVMRVAAALVGTADAEDAAQEALMRAWQAEQGAGQIAAPRAWLLRITVNLCTDWCRGRFGTRRRVTRSIAEVSGAEGADDLATLEFDPGTSDHTGALDVRRAISDLDRDLRLVVVLRYYAGLESAEIGELLGVPAATVRTRLRRALSLLRERLAQPQPNQPNADDPKGGR